MSQSDHPPGFLFEDLSANDHIKFAIKQHISADIKSLFRLAKASGISRNEFENIVQREFEHEHEHELANVHEPADDNAQEDHNELANENASGDEEELENEEDDLSDTVSRRSTVEYDHEPFETFQDKVLHFVPTLWGGDNAEETSVSRMAGGGFNRIIGISRRALGQPSLSEYILRIPRLDSARIDLDVAALLYVRKLGNTPVPEVIAFDTTSNNKLGDRYMVQKKLTGTDMLSTFPNLNHDQKCRVASGLGHFFSQILSKKSAVAGKPALPSGLTKANENSEDLCVEPLFQTEIQTTDQLEPNLLTKDLLCRTFEERKLDAKRRNDTWRPQLMDQFIDMVNELHGDGWFMNNDISLCHLDLEPRNILINAQQDESQPIVSGILDWDSAVLAPSFMSCTPPLWVWAWSEDEEEDERTANDVPPTEEGRELKKLFEEAAGAEFVRYAYPPAYRLARRLVRFAVEELRFAEQFKEAEAMLKEWKGIRGVSKPQDCL